MRSHFTSLALPLALSSLALAAPLDDLEPLPSERQLAEPEEVALEFARLEVPGSGLIGWTRTSVRRGRIDGATHYLVHRIAERLDFERLGFETIESRGLYDADLGLVHEVRRTQALGADDDPLELKWTDEGLRWRNGRGRWRSVDGEGRPTPEADVALFVHGLAVETPWTGLVFDVESESLQPQTLRAGEETTVDDEPMIVFEVEGATPMRHYLRTDGEYMESRMEPLRIVGVEAGKNAELGLRRALADAAAFEEVLALQLPKGWEEKRRTYTHAALGMSLELPRGWRRADDREVDGTHFHAFSADSNAYASLAVSVLGTGYSLEDWSEGLVEFFTEQAVDGELESESVTFAKQDAVRFEYVRAGDAPLTTTAYAWERGGFGFLFVGGAWVDGPKKLHTETGRVLESVKFAR